MPAHTSATKAGFLQRLKDRRFQILLSKQVMLLLGKVGVILLGAIAGMFKSFAKGVGKSIQEGLPVSPDAIADCDNSESTYYGWSESGYQNGPEGHGYYTGGQKLHD
ncbi:hypothetical protein WH50_03335 [Pokkaliibacter plantistimulans]|uniref:Uncharacterized protein n=1 Tax=Pokkaliibacter plantistimulans TaxID=1635171 RepID=A0ABX5M4K7_9GAMM|nr:hypothetical protein [Pokkaliibacter plantistimulans]PXF32628.1 hypothetical protein WH50_03335 [Pokkaliibacter plantistimulans]